MTWKRNPRHSNLPDLGQLDDVVAPRILGAMHAASRRLTEIGVRHALVGGLAVGAYGHPRATKDVDFLVGGEAFHRSPSGIITFASEMPLAVNDVIVDSLLPADDEGFLHAAIARAIVAGDVPIVPVDALVYMKLHAGRRKDLGDVAALVKSGVLDVEIVGAYLKSHAPHLVAALGEIVDDVESGRE
jgi:hypothetical protein